LKPFRVRYSDVLDDGPILQNSGTASTHVQHQCRAGEPRGSHRPDAPRVATFEEDEPPHGLQEAFVKLENQLMGSSTNRESVQSP
jgi:hypothetical protein